MAKDYFQDILPPQGKGPRTPLSRDPDVRPAAVTEETIEEGSDATEKENLDEEELSEPAPEKSIRNISAPPRRVRDDTQETPRYAPPMPRPRRFHRMWIWILAAAGVLVAGALLLIALRGTSVSVIPRSHTVVFDETSRFIAYPAASAASGTLAYATQTIELEDSESVEATGTVHAEEKASGIVTVVNDYSTKPVRLVKNTRFESPEGLIFRAPADIVVPPKQGVTPGQVTVSVVADQPGTQYNIPPSKLTIPGLKGGPEYAGVYAQSTAAMTGGFSGDRPGVSESEMAAAKAAVRGRLEQKIRESVAGLAQGDVLAFPELAHVTIEDLPVTADGSKARINEKASVIVPLIPARDLAQAVARTVSADADSTPVRMVGMKEFGALLVNASTTVGTDPLQFALTGQAMLVWEVNPDELAQALAGRDQSAFQTIVQGFPGIQSATARIEPFWSTSFPNEASRIRVKIADPTGQKGQ